MIVCIQCNLEALVAGKEPVFDTVSADNDEHNATFHPNGVTPEERADLEARAKPMIEKILEDKKGVE